MPGYRSLPIRSVGGQQGQTDKTSVGPVSTVHRGSNADDLAILRCINRTEGECGVIPKRLCANSRNLWHLHEFMKTASRYTALYNAGLVHKAGTHCRRELLIQNPERSCCIFTGIFRLCGRRGQQCVMYLCGKPGKLPSKVILTGVHCRRDVPKFCSGMRE